SCTPILPVEQRSTSSRRRRSCRAASTAVAIAFRSPSTPVAAFAMPALRTTACGIARSRCARDTVTGAACARFVVNIAPPTAGTVVWTTARSSHGSDEIPALTAPATKPRAAVTLTRRPRARLHRAPRETEASAGGGLGGAASLGGHVEVVGDSEVQLLF